MRESHWLIVICCSLGHLVESHWRWRHRITVLARQTKPFKPPNKMPVRCNSLQCEGGVLHCNRHWGDIELCSHWSVELVGMVTLDFFVARRVFRDD